MALLIVSADQKSQPLKICKYTVAECGTSNTFDAEVFCQPFEKSQTAAMKNLP